MLYQQLNVKFYLDRNQVFTIFTLNFSAVKTRNKQPHMSKIVQIYNSNDRMKKMRQGHLLSLINCHLREKVENTLHVYHTVQNPTIFFAREHRHLDVQNYR
jgi:hypothetical protein